MPGPAFLADSAIWLDAVTPTARFFGALSACILACGFLGFLAWRHRRRLSRIPVRIHVTGTRGKSSTARLIAAGLRAGGYRVVAKVTGTRPCLILPDGTERPVRRWGAADIREQRALVAAAHRAGADTLVAEAMAIEPEYLQALERFYIRATDLVVTNLRPDHYEQLGFAAQAMAEAVVETVPASGRVWLGREAADPRLLARASAQRCEVRVLAPAPDADPEADNRALALEVCGRYGVGRETCEQAMRGALSDVGAFAIQTLEIEGRRFRFANAFSCNDAASLERLWRAHHDPLRPVAFLFNPRVDRPLRTRALLELLARLAPDSRLILLGGFAGLRRQARAAGFRSERIRELAHRALDLRALSALVEDGGVVWGVGNFRGAGEKLIGLIAARPRTC